MKQKRVLLLTSIFFALTSTAFAQDKQSLFNGTDLTGWWGNPKLWSVNEGSIQGQTTPENPTKGNTFLVYTNGVVGDFELRFSYKITGGNSGVQYRSKVVNSNNWVVGGYQADIDSGTRYSGILYDEAGVAGGRGIMAERGEKVAWGEDCKKQVTGSLGKSEEMQAKINKDGWNEYLVTVQGNHFVHKINGVTTVDVTDNCEAKRLKSGVLALQLHAGPPMTVLFKDLHLRKL
jgi:hypothetical protein